MAHPSKYFADDKDIFDLLMSQRRKLSDDLLRRLLRDRGIVVGPELERQHLAQYMSRLPFGMRDLRALLDRVGTPSHRAPKTTSEGVEVTVDAMEAAANEVRDARSERRGEVYKVHRKADGTLEISVNYSVLDTAKSRLRQRSEQHLAISVEPVPGSSSVRIRYPEEERSREVAEAIIFRALGDPKEITRETISLDGCNAEQRTTFFESLMSNIAGFSLRTVTRAGFRRLDDATSDSELDGDVEGETLPGFEDEETGARIIRVTLDGAGVFSSDEFVQLKRSGFYVNSAVWRSRMDGGEGLDAEFDAAFVVGQTGSAFAYRLRGVFRRDEDGEHASTRESPSEDERNRFLRALEDAATSAKEAATTAAGIDAVPQALDEPDEQETAAQDKTKSSGRRRGKRNGED